MMRIAFYLKNKNTLNCSKIIDGNPGLGGSEYLIILIPTLLSLKYKDIEVTLYTDYQGQLPRELHTIACSSFEDFASLCSKNEEDYCVVNYTSVQNNVIKNSPNLNFIIWCHNFASWKNLDFYARQHNVVRIITVGREQLDLYRDHPAFEKSDYIYNAIPTDSLKEKVGSIVPFKDRKNNVIYIGSLIECKGFIHLAKAWKKVLKAVPDATLYVIGKGNLYDEKAKLGRLKLADETFENKFASYISDEKGILPSVTFLGILGEEKFDIIKKCKVGVPNPGGLTETFGLTAIEMQAMGCIVTSIECPGYLDTIFDKNMLYHKTSQLANYIIRGLKTNHTTNINDIFSFIEKNFSYDVIILQWHKILTECIPQKQPLHSKKMLINDTYHYKRWKELMRKNKDDSLLKIIPPLERIFYKQH